MFQRIAAVLMVLALAMGLFAQGKSKTPAERSVTGVVTDASGTAVVGAVVQLKNTRTLQVRSFITRDKGEFYFNGLSTDIDYELKAVQEGKETPVRTLSTFNAQSKALINLQFK